MLTFLFFVIWPFRKFLRFLRVMTSLKLTLGVLCLCCCLLPIAVGLPMLLVLPSASDTLWTEYGFSAVILLILIGGPLVGVALLLAAWQGSVELLQFGICMFLFFPGLVLLPIFIVGTSDGEFTAVGCVALPFLIGVTVFTIAINISAQRLQAEQKAKVFVHKLRAILRGHRVLITPEVARFVCKQPLLSSAVPSFPPVHVAYFSLFHCSNI